jgi:hypothetical protein
MADRRNHNSPRDLGFDIKPAEIRAIRSPIYRGFGLVSERIWSWSYFYSSTRIGYASIGINRKGKNSRHGTRSKWTRPCCWPWLATLVQLGSIGSTGSSLGHAWKKQGKARLGGAWQKRLGCAGPLSGPCVGERKEVRLGWVGVWTGFRPIRLGKIENPLSFSKSITNFKSKWIQIKFEFWWLLLAR